MTFVGRGALGGCVVGAGFSVVVVSGDVDVVVPGGAVAVEEVLHLLRSFVASSL
jgi:hypothetical protein